MMSRRAFLAGSVTLLAAPVGVEGQQLEHVWRRVGVLYPATLDPIRLEAIRKGIEDSARTLGHRVVLETRSAHSHAEQLGPLAADLVRAHVDVIFAIGP